MRFPGSYTVRAPSELQAMFTGIEVEELVIVSANGEAAAVFLGHRNMQGVVLELLPDGHSLALPPSILKAGAGAVRWVCIAPD